MKSLYFALKYLREMWRNPLMMGLFLAFPPFLVLLYFFAFGPSSSGMASFMNLKVLNEDQGPTGAALIQYLRDSQFEGKAVYQIEEVKKSQQADLALAEGKTSMFVHIPANFSASFKEASAGKDRAMIELTGNPENDSYAFSLSFLNSSFEEFSALENGGSRPVTIQTQFVENTGKLSDFQFGVPGILVFGILFGVITAAELLVREESHDTLKRIRLSNARSFDLLMGIILCQAILSLAQIPLTLGTAWLCGLQTPGALWLIGFICLILSLPTTGAGLLAACFSKNESESANIATGIMVPLVFLSNTVYMLPSAPLFTLGGRSFQLYDVLPTTHAAEALRRVILYGDGFTEIGFSLIALILLSALYLAFGISLYQYRKLNRGDMPSRANPASALES